MSLTYCTSCRKKTGNVNASIVQIAGKGGAPRYCMKSTCTVCHKHKSGFVKAPTSAAAVSAPKTIRKRRSKAERDGKGFFGGILGGIAGKALGGILPF